MTRSNNIGYGPALALAATILCAPNAQSAGDGYPLPIRKPGTQLNADMAPTQEPAFFKIATGSTAGTYFAAGEALAALISHPPGAERCLEEGRCGPVGMLAVAQNSVGAVRNIKAVNEGDIQSGLAPADLLNDAAFGTGEFNSDGQQTQVRAIASLYTETLHLVVAKDSNIADLDGLTGRRISRGPLGSGSHTYANLLLGKRGLTGSVEQFDFDLYDSADQLMSGDLDAFFHLGGAPVPFIQDLLATGAANLIAIRGEPVAVLYESRSYIKPYLIANSTYAGTAQIETIGTNAVWIVNAAVSDERVYQITRALWQAENRVDLRDSEKSIGWYEVDQATQNLPIPLHPGAERFYNNDRIAETVEVEEIQEIETEPDAQVDPTEPDN